MANWTSLDDIERDFNKKIKAAGDDADEVRELRISLSEAKAEFREQQAEKRALEAAKRAALVDYPLAAKFAGLITGSTAEEIEEKAKQLHEGLQALQPPPPDPKQAARDAYGDTSAVGGGTPPKPQQDPNDAFLADFANKFNSGQAITQKEFERYERLRLGRRFAEAIGEGGKRWSLADLPWTEEGRRKAG